MKKIGLHRITALIFSVCCVLLLLSACNSGSQGGEDITSSPENTAPLTVTVTFTEGSNAVQFAMKLEENGVCSANDFLACVNNAEYLSLLPVSITNAEERAFLLEGYLFPDTYEFYCNTSADTVLRKILDNTTLKINESYKARAAELGYTMDEIISLASIIQEEAGNPDEMPYVSSVIHNRLDSPSYPYIECDVAIKYLENFVKPYFTEEEYDEICWNYNIVRKRKGLPSGAITNPGAAAIEAALYPADTDYFFFVTDAEGNYYYAHTYSKHRENCRLAGIQGNY